MSFSTPLQISDWVLAVSGTRYFVYHENRIPRECAVLVVSNHRSAMDAFLLMSAIRRSIRFACHHYMGQVPVMHQVVQQLGGFPLEAPEHRQQSFFRQATELLQQQQVVGVFPEGAQPMVKLTDPLDMGTFQRGFAHLALRAPVSNLAVLPIAIASMEEMVNSAFPLKFLSLFDPSEPLFNQPGWHPMVVYRRVNVLMGRPYWVAPTRQADYQGKKAKLAVTELTDYCHAEIAQLLHQH